MSKEEGRDQNESQDERRHDEDAKHHPFEVEREKEKRERGEDGSAERA